MKTVIALCAVIGALTVVATLIVGHGSPTAATPEYGKRLLAQTPQYPVAIRSGLSCSSCHINAGSEPGALSLIAAIGRYPGNIADRIDECVVRNMNGRPLRKDGVEMIAMVSWLRFLADEDAARGAVNREDHDPPAFRIPTRAADPEAGEQLFTKRCADCHGKDGAGVPASRNPAQGYLFPPLWGSGSFPDASEMHGIPTSARFIKAKMPLGRPDLDSDQAFDLAAFINSKPRPHYRGLQKFSP